MEPYIKVGLYYPKGQGPSIKFARTSERRGRGVRQNADKSGQGGGVSAYADVSKIALLADFKSWRGTVYCTDELFLSLTMTFAVYEHADGHVGDCWLSYYSTVQRRHYTTT